MKKILSSVKSFFIKIGLTIKYMFVDKPEEVEELVSFSGTQKIANLDEEQVSYYSNVLHKNDAKAAEKIQNSLCYIVLGVISFILGILFIFLSIRKRVSGRIAGINFASLQFVICVVCLVLAVILLTIGLYKAISARNRRKQYHHYIMLLSRRGIELKEKTKK